MWLPVFSYLPAVADVEISEAIYHSILIENNSSWRHVFTSAVCHCFGRSKPDVSWPLGKISVVVGLKVQYVRSGHLTRSYSKPTGGSLARFNISKPFYISVMLAKHCLCTAEMRCDLANLSPVCPAINCSLLHYVNYVQLILELFCWQQLAAVAKNTLFFICLELQRHKKTYMKSSVPVAYSGVHPLVFLLALKSRPFFPYFSWHWWTFRIRIRIFFYLSRKGEISSSQQPKDRGVVINNNYDKRINNTTKKVRNRKSLIYIVYK